MLSCMINYHETWTDRLVGRFNYSNHLPERVGQRLGNFLAETQVTVKDLACYVKEATERRVDRKLRQRTCSLLDC